MRIHGPWRFLAVVLAGGLALAAPGVATMARPRKPPPVAAPPPPPPPAPAGPVGLPDRMVQDAAAFDGYMRHAVAISPAFTDAASVSLALGQARAYGPRALLRGATAFAAIAALQERDFVAALREAGNTPEHRALMVDYIVANPAYLTNFKGFDIAAGLAQAAMAPGALNLVATGRIVRQSAYAIQKQPWSKAEVSDLSGRLSATESTATREMPVEPERLAEARAALSGASPLPNVAAGPALTAPYPPLVTRAIQLAAIAALGEATDGSYGRLAALATDADAEACLSAAKRDFHQCLAVAKPNYEDVFCMGQHALRDTGVCLARAVGVQPPPEPIPPPTKAKTKPKRRKPMS